MSLKGKNLGVRTLSGAVLAVAVVGTAVWSPWAFAVLVAFISLIGMREFFGLAHHRKGISPQIGFAIAAGTSIILTVVSKPEYESLLYLLLWLPTLFVVELFQKSEHPLENIAVGIMSIVYTAVPMAMLILIGFASGEWDCTKVLAIVFLVWINDIFAYLVGCTIGRHRLCERLSPKKSWEGFIGGLVCSVGAAIGFGTIVKENIWVWAGLGVVVVLGGVAGDLIESMFKREADVKDSGKIIPGHGGILDRFDAMFMAVPFAFFYLLFNI